MDRINRIAPALIVAIFSLSASYAQSSVHAAGGDAAGSGGTAAYAVGQVSYTFTGNETGSVSLGVQQSYKAMTVGNQEIEAGRSVALFPNPVQSNTFLQLEAEPSELEKDAFSYAIYDIYGRLMHQQDIHQATTVITLSDYHNAMYIVKVIRNEYTLRTFKVIKSN
jgi:hypothetical protein